MKWPRSLDALDTSAISASTLGHDDAGGVLERLADDAVGEADTGTGAAERARNRAAANPSGPSTQRAARHLSPP